ncbi:hypothetical protein ES288_A08G192400v1 [Gossypium darwinii]|uniref:Uncharacterized protein n=1 Tax=Gossypium darwinii TaxID=34276 RepID=A0A5D2FNJ5_GOSDA|nr:hypothetical protein ES288_A08G192400v1 [Gossypium darwinii]
MTNIPIIALLFVSFCVSTFFNFANAFGMPFIVVGHVYCDTCRVELEPRSVKALVVYNQITFPFSTMNRINKSYTYRSKHIVTDKKGNYEIEVPGDYKESDCDVILVRSPRQDCNDPTGKWRKTKVVLTISGGVKGNVRVAKSLGFKKRTPLPGCNKVLKEMRLF